MPPFTFTDEDFKGIDPLHEDPMVIMVDIGNLSTMKMLMDQGSLVDILYWKTFKNMRIAEEEMKFYDDQFVGFLGERVGPWGYIELYTTFGEGKMSKTIKIWYLVIDVNTSYNILLGWSSINRLRVIVSTPHLVMKIPSISGDILTVHVLQKVARECYATSLRVEPLWNDSDRAYGDPSPRRKFSRRCKSPRREDGLERREYTVALVDLDP